MQRTYVRAELELDAAVMRLVLIAHPRLLEVEEVSWALTRPGASDPVSLAPSIDRLVGCGLIRIEERIVPSAAALFFDRLPID